MKNNTFKAVLVGLLAVGVLVLYATSDKKAKR